MTRRTAPVVLLGTLLLLAACGGSGGATSAGPAGPAGSTGGGVSSGDVSPGSEVSTGGGVSTSGGVSPGGGAPASDSGVRGRVTTTDGEPVAGATVLRTPVDPARPVTQEAAVTGPDGRYAWSLSPGTWDITVEAPGLVTRTERVTVEEGRTAQLDLVLTRR